MAQEREYSNEISKWLQEFIRQDSASGILLIAAAVLALVLENSPLNWFYDALLVHQGLAQESPLQETTARGDHPQR